MNTLVQINTVCNSGSVGRIAEGIGKKVLEYGWRSIIAYGRDNPISQSEIYAIGNKRRLYLNALETRILDNDGFLGTRQTKQLIDYLKVNQPSLIQLHNLHGYYIESKILFDFLKQLNIPIVWTLHDCWAFTGHCYHFENIGCYRWLNQCHHCPQKKEYPASLCLDKSKSNYELKKETYNSIENLHIISPSAWLDNLVGQSFLRNANRHIIPNGIDISQFRPTDYQEIKCKYSLGNRKIVLGVANRWNKTKGLEYFVELSKQLPDVSFIVIGKSDYPAQQFPSNMITIDKTENTSTLAALYTMADVYVNPTIEDNFPTTNLEAMACGTPVVTFDTGGCKEAITKDVGIVVPQKNTKLLSNAVEEILQSDKKHYRDYCIDWITKYYDQNKRFQNYVELYNSLVL